MTNKSEANEQLSCAINSYENGKATERTRVLGLIAETRLRWEKLRNDNPNNYIDDKQQWRIYEEHCCGAIAFADELLMKVEEGR